tara:strand:+ start:19473 stop:20399 length:927 start_codon:yes stop_codon:yes gene_type:complete
MRNKKIKMDALLKKGSSNTLIFVLTLFVILSCSNDNEIDAYLSIPDSHFETILIEQGIDSDGMVNHQMLRSDAKEVAQLDLNLSANFGEIVDLTGIEGFVNLRLLSASGQKIEHVDLSANTLLDTLYLTANLISSIDLSNNTNLVLVDIQSNELSSINGLSNATNLKDLDLSWNYFEEFSMDNASLEVLHMRNNDLKALNINGAVNLKHILLTTNLLSSLDVSNNTLMETLLIADNRLEHMNFEFNNNLTHLYIFDNSLLSLDVSANENMIDLKADRNPDLSCIKIQNGQNIPLITLSDYQALNTLCN